MNGKARKRMFVVYNYNPTDKISQLALVKGSALATKPVPYYVQRIRGKRHRYLQDTKKFENMDRGELQHLVGKGIY